MTRVARAPTQMRTLAAPAASRSLFSSLRQCPLWCTLFLVCLLLPTDLSVMVGAFRLSPYRILLLIAFVPCLMRLASGRAGQIVPTDWLLLLFIIWAFIGISIHHGPSRALESVGVNALELLGAYLVARSCITSRQQLLSVLSALIVVMMVLVPFTIFESITGRHIIREVGSALAGSSFHAPMDKRMGLHRSFGPYDHPILYGVFAASMVGFAWFMLQTRSAGQRMGHALGLGAVIGGAITSVSSGAIVALNIQFMLAIYERLTRSVPRRWQLLVVLMLIGYVFIDVVSTRPAYLALLARLTFSAHTAYNRVIIFQYGSQDVIRNPFFGIGYNVWTRPPWMHSTSMDNFWLVQAVTFGFVGFLLLAIAVLVSLFIRWKGLKPEDHFLRTGWTISMIGVIVSGCTVHFWNSTYVYFAFLLGCGAIFSNGLLHARPVPPRHKKSNAPTHVVRESLA